MEPEFIRDGKQFSLGFIPSPHKGIFISLFFTIFTTVTGVGIVVPLLPIYAHDLGASGIYVGLIFGSFAFSRTLFLPYFGRLSDKKGRKPFIMGGLIGYALISIAFIFSDTVTTLIALRFIQGISSAMIMPVVQAYVGEITPKGQEGYSMGLFNMSMFASLSLGPLMGGVIKDAWSLDAAFGAMALLSALGLILCIIFLPPVSKELARSKDRPSVPWGILMKDGDLTAIFIFRTVYTACIGIIWCFLPLFAEIRFELSGSFTGILVTLGVLISGLMQLPMGYAADRWNKKILVIVGGLVSAAGMMLLFSADSFSNLIFGVSLFGLGGGTAMPAVMAMAVIKGHELEAMASVMALITMAHSLGMMAGSMGAGAAMDFFRLEFVFPCGAALMAGGVLGFYILTAKSKVSSPKKLPIR